MKRLLKQAWLPAIGLLAMSGAVAFGMPQGARPQYEVKIEDEKAVVVEPVLPVDPVRRINYQFQGNMGVMVRSERNETLHLGVISTLLKIDEQVLNPGTLGRIEVQNARLPKTATGKGREGYYSVYLNNNNVRITQTVEVVPTKPQGQNTKRRRDAVLVRYAIENKDAKPHRVGVRIFLDTYVINNDGCLFAAPTMPNKVLDGVELKDKTLPDYVQLLQRPDLKNPGFVSHFTYALGRDIERPTRVVLTGLGAGGDNWNVNVRQAGGDSAMAFFWEPKEIKPGAKREVAYAYGQGIAYPPTNEGQIQLVLGGSFEPGKLFTIAAYVQDPAPGQSLTLELPDGMKRVEGKAIQPVPPTDDDGNCMVLWKARVMTPGRHALRVHSTSGVTQTKVITVTQLP